MMSFLIHTEPAGKLKRMFDKAGQNEVVLVRPGVVSNRRNKTKAKIYFHNGRGFHREGKCKKMPWNESGRQN